MVTKEFPRIVFMGTPEFAVASLDALVQAGYNVVGVITAPDKPAGRGMKLTESAVKKYATEHNLFVLQPEKLKNPVFLKELIALRADLQIVVAFRMLPEAVWNMPAMGTVNVHGSLLPQYRGAAPINWAVINGERETGVTTFKLKHEIDTGDILMQESFAIGEDETAGEVHDRMKEIGAQLLVKTVEGLVNGSLEEKPQEETGNEQWAMGNGQEAIGRKEEGMGNWELGVSTPNSGATLPPARGLRRAGITDHSSLITHHSSLRHAPKIFTDTCKIDFSKSVEEVHNLIRGLSPFPGAFTYFNDKMMKIYRSKMEITDQAASSNLSDEGAPIEEKIKTQAAPGGQTVTGSNFLTDGKTYLKFACSNGYIQVLELQLEGKKKMLVEDFLRGYRS